MKRSKKKNNSLLDLLDYLGMYHLLERDAGRAGISIEQLIEAEIAKRQSLLIASKKEDIEDSLRSTSSAELEKLLEIQEVLPELKEILKLMVEGNNTSSRILNNRRMYLFGE